MKLVFLNEQLNRILISKLTTYEIKMLRIVKQNMLLKSYSIQALVLPPVSFLYW